MIQTTTKEHTMSKQINKADVAHAIVMIQHSDQEGLADLRAEIGDQQFAAVMAAARGRSATRRIRVEELAVGDIVVRDDQEWPVRTIARTDGEFGELIAVTFESGDIVRERSYSAGDQLSVA